MRTLVGWSLPVIAWPVRLFVYSEWIMLVVGNQLFRTHNWNVKHRKVHVYIGKHRRNDPKDILKTFFTRNITRHGINE
jgi:hypothetical protein